MQYSVEVLYRHHYGPVSTIEKFRYRTEDIPDACEICRLFYRSAVFIRNEKRELVQMLVSLGFFEHSKPRNRQRSL